MREDGAWSIDASVALDDTQRITLMIARGRALPASWTLLAEAPIRLDGLGNYGRADEGALPDRSGIERLVFAPEGRDGEIVDSVDANAVEVVETLVSATRSPLTVPQLLASIAQLLGVVGSSAFVAHPAVAGLGTARSDAPGRSHPPVWRAPFLDAIVGDDSTLVLVAFAGAAEVIHLGGPAARIWAAADGSDAESTVRRAQAGPADPGEWDEYRHALRDLRERALVLEEPSWRRSLAVAWADGGDHAALVSSQGEIEAPLMLAGSAYSVWRRLCADQATSFGDLVSAVAADYGLEGQEIADDVRALLEQLGESAATVHV